MTKNKAPKYETEEKIKDVLEDDPISRTNDYVFKKVFNDKDILSDLLSGLLGEKIVVTEILNPEIPPESLLDKLSRMDILALDSRGELFSVEVQMQYHEGFDDRTSYYGTDAHSDSVKKGGKYAQIKRTVIVDILAFRHGRLTHKPHYHATFKLRNEDASVTLTEKLAIHYVEVPKMTDMLNNMPPEKALTLTKEDKWVLYLNDCGGELMERIANEEPMIAKALKIGEIFNYDNAERQRARARQDAIVGWNIAMSANYYSGVEQGIEQGKAEGIEQGKLEVARNLLSRKIPPDVIAESTGLSLEKIQALMK